MLSVFVCVHACVVCLGVHVSVVYVHCCHYDVHRTMCVQSQGLSAVVRVELGHRRAYYRKLL